jgi:hypothetical protein
MMMSRVFESLMIFLKTIQKQLGSGAPRSLYSSLVKGFASKILSQNFSILLIFTSFFKSYNSLSGKKLLLISERHAFDLPF